MKSPPSFAVLLESFFTQRLMKQRLASPHTIRSYRDTFHLLLHFIQQRLSKQPSQLELTEIDAPLIAAFLDEMESSRNITPRSRNVRLAAIRSFFRYAALEAPAHSALIQRVLAIPSKRHTRRLVTFLTQPEVAALLAVPDQRTWSGRRDHALLLVAVQTGLRLSEMTGLQQQDVVVTGTGAHVCVIGKGRKERCTPLTKKTAAVLKAWMRDPANANTATLFPNARGGRLSRDGVQYIPSTHIARACETCTSLKKKASYSPFLETFGAMALLHAGIDGAMIALWLGHESVETTQMYLHANLALKEKILSHASMAKESPDTIDPMMNSCPS